MKKHLIALAIGGVWATVFSAFGMANATAPSNPAPDRPHDLCRHEDGSGQRFCVWDAAHQGNGVGQSFIAIRGGGSDGNYIDISHRRAHRLTH